MKYSISFLIVSIMVIGVLLMGCSQSQQGSRAERVAVRASIETDCVAHYYKTNTSSYITRQQHGFNPSVGFFQAASSEPIGVVQCSLTKDRYTSSDLKGQSLSDLPGTFWSENLAAVVYYSFCAGSGLLETDAMASGENIKIEGQWYKPLKPAWPNGIDLTLLQSLDTKRIERVQMHDPKTGLSWLVSNYNIRYNNELSTRCPRTIDVFDIRNGVASKELMIRFDYTTIKRAQTQNLSGSR